MVNISPGQMIAARGVIQLIAKKAVLPVEKKMEQRPTYGKDPHPATQWRVTWFFREFYRRGDYCTFLAGAASPVLIIVAVFV